MWTLNKLLQRRGARLWASLVVPFCLVLLATAVSALASEEPGDESQIAPETNYIFDEMVVSASKTEEAIDTIPKHVTIITDKDIRESAGENIIDLLGREAGINIRSNTGSDKHSVVDLRGMGDTASSNVIVMVDGLSINTPDMSGPALSSIPIDHIERIEIVRGAGSVIYGSGAVGGVVNIITRKPGEIPSGDLSFSYGSYDTLGLRGTIDSRAGDFGLRLSAGVYDSDGYRDNGFLKKNDLHINTRYEFGEKLSFLLGGTYYEDEYGLPGPVSGTDIHSRSRRVKTRWPDDAGESSELRGVAGVEIDLADMGILTLKRGYNISDDSFVMGYTDALPRRDQKTETDEDTRRVDLNYIKDYRLFDRFHTIQAGIDHSKTEYVRENQYNGLRENSLTESFGIFINNQFSLTDALLLTAGTRYNTYQGRFRTDERKLFETNDRMWINGEVEKKEWNNNAWALGISYRLNKTTSVFSSYNTSFRIPNVDEFAVSEEGLSPQEGKHIEIGGRHRFGTFAALTVSLFDIRIEDEIYYSEINRNYDDTTIRRGIETDIKVFPVYFLNIWGNYTYTDATFDEKKTTVPLVPTHMLSAGLQLFPIDGLSLFFSGTYAGSMYDGNDPENSAYEKIDAYAVFDAKMTYDRKNVSIFCGVNNILDNLYSTSAYNEQYYPMPGRNIYGGVKWNFR